MLPLVVQPWMLQKLYKDSLKKIKLREIVNTSAVFPSISSQSFRFFLPPPPPSLPPTGEVPLFMAL